MSDDRGGGMALREVRHVSASIARDWCEIYEAFWRPEAFPRWASGLSQSRLIPDGPDFLARGPEGDVRIRFTPHNSFGVMDHVVTLADGSRVDIPLRIVPNGAGAEVTLTLFRQPGMDEATFARDAEWVARDLAALKRLAEAGGAAP